MITAWAAVAGIILVSSAAVLLMTRRAQREIEPTIRAFDDLRAALRPAVAGLRGESDALRGDLSALHGPGETGARR